MSKIRQGYVDITGAKNNFGLHLFIHKSYNEIVDEIVEMRPKTGQK